MGQERTVGWMCFAILVVIFTTYAAMALGGTEPFGTLYAAENQTARGAGVLGVLLAVLLIAASAGAERVLRGLALGLSAVALAGPALYVAAQQVEPAVSDTISCGTVSSPQIYSTTLERQSCEEGLRDQKVVVVLLAVVPTVVGAASLLVLARRTPTANGGQRKVPLPPRASVP